MSADLLRRAATRLRGYAKLATEGSWVYDGDAESPPDGGGESIGAGFTDSVEDGQMVYVHHPDDFGIPLGQHDGKYVALMHPPVALALAELLADSADSLDQELGVVQDSATAGAIDVARAILREGS